MAHATTYELRTRALRSGGREELQLVPVISTLIHQPRN